MGLRNACTFWLALVGVEMPAGVMAVGVGADESVGEGVVDKDFMAGGALDERGFFAGTLGEAAILAFLGCEEVFGEAVELLFDGLEAFFSFLFAVVHELLEGTIGLLQV